MRPIPMGSSSWYTKRLPRGCRLCRQGAKMVLLVTGRCGESCYYCPLSEAKKGRDVVYANELRVASDEDIVREAEAMGARGTGITGGDPLLVMDRTVRYVRLLKERFGTAHHIHLYTATVDRERFLRLQEAGLDELRVHPPIRHWGRLGDLGLTEAVEGLDMKVGFEVPVVPGEGEGLIALCRFAAANGLAFVNLNELEVSETNCQALLARGLHVRSDVSSAIEGSERTAMAVMEEVGDAVPVHFCSSSFKDRVQLRERLKRRAKRVARPLDLVTSEGMVLLGVVETQDLEGAYRLLRDAHGVPAELMAIERGRLEVAPWVLEALAPGLPFPCFLVEEYPTADRLEVERRPLG
ncbi:MAG TPA: radical SAM protein [Methanomassiliicoccales archaeon]|nr:radical SAM protein [Methanomassiliicoccales archaeon]